MEQENKSFNNNNLSLPSLGLASHSPRRKLILSEVGFRFSTLSIDVKECDPVGLKAPDLTLRNAKLKAEAGLKLWESQKHRVVIGCDTVVAVDDAILGKPQSREQAASHLEKLSGQTHQVTSGLVLGNDKGDWLESHESTQVTFHLLCTSQISAYCETQEPYDKAGGYAIQGLASLFVKEVRGSYTNVVGFPLELFLSQLEKLTGIPPFQWIKSS